LDYGERYRDLPYIGTLDPKVYASQQFPAHSPVRATSPGVHPPPGSEPAG
jgi:hypothetical protein